MHALRDGSALGGSDRGAPVRRADMSLTPQEQLSLAAFRPAASLRCYRTHTESTRPIPFVNDHRASPGGKSGIRRKVGRNGARDKTLRPSGIPPCDPYRDAPWHHSRRSGAGRSVVRPRTGPSRIEVISSFSGSRTKLHVRPSTEVSHRRTARRTSASSVMPSMPLVTSSIWSRTWHSHSTREATPTLPIRGAPVCWRNTSTISPLAPVGLPRDFPC